jgi:hypothetical protein
VGDRAELVAELALDRRARRRGGDCAVLVAAREREFDQEHASELGGSGDRRAPRKLRVTTLLDR